ncbi:MAG: PRC-barrel domain-containing protein, partial [Microcystis sp.]
YKLLVPKSDRPQLEADEYHVSELIGLVVYNQLTGEKLGEISDIFFSGNDILEVELFAQKHPSEIDQELINTKKNKSKPAKPTTILIPFVKEIVPLVDLKAARIEISPPPGLLEINLS